MVARVFEDAFRDVHNRVRRQEQVEADQAVASGIGASLLEAAHVQLTALKTENAQLRDQVTSLQDSLAGERQAHARTQAQAQSSASAASDHSQRAERERARADEHAAARLAADALAQREREARIVAESRPPQIIREPAPSPVAVDPPPAALPAAVAAPVLPDPPKKLRMRIMGRDPNGLISDIEWIPGE